jgi:hypothetical protein
MKHGFFTTLLNPSNDDEVQEEAMTWFKEQAMILENTVIITLK